MLDWNVISKFEDIIESEVDRRAVMTYEEYCSMIADLRETFAEAVNHLYYKMSGEELEI